MGDERERFEALRQVYESRIDSLTSSVRKVYLSLKSDEVGLAIRESPGLEGHYRDHLEEIVESELAQEREEFVRRLAGSVSQFQARIVELERHSGATAHQLSRSEAALASLQQQSAAREAASAAALREAATKCQQASSDNAGLKSELAVALDELDSASASFHQSRERGMAFEGQLASMNEKCQAMLEQLVATEVSSGGGRRGLRLNGVAPCIWDVGPHSCLTARLCLPNSCRPRTPSCSRRSSRRQIRRLVGLSKRGCSRSAVGPRRRERSRSSSS